MPPWIGSIIENLKIAKEMWEKVEGDAATKSTLFLIGAEDQLATMQVSDSDNPHPHLTKFKQHFDLMTELSAMTRVHRLKRGILSNEIVNV